MSEKPALDPEPAVEKTDQDQQDQDRADAPKATSRPRLWKFFCYIFADAELRGLHRFALTHAHEAYRMRWEELTGWVSPWVMLLFAPVGDMKIRPDFWNSEVGFAVEVACFSLYSYWYSSWNQGDKYQLHFLVTAVALGLLPLLYLGTGLLIGIFCVVPRAILSGLLVSDIFHLFWDGKVSNKPHMIGNEAVSGEKV